MTYSSADFKLDLRRCVVPGSALWVNSGYATCSPLADTSLGVAGCFSPPLAAPDTVLGFELDANGHLVRDLASHDNHYDGLLFTGGEWFPDKIVRKGSYHRRIDGILVSFAVVSELVPLTGQAGFVVKLTVKNRTSDGLHLKIKPLVTAGHPRVMPLKDWDYTPPKPANDEAVPAGERAWENGEVRVSLLAEGGEEKVLAGLTSHECRFAVVFTRTGEAVMQGSLAQWQEQTRQRWQNLLDLTGARIPVISGDVPGLPEYCRRSLVSGLVCLWENDAFVTKPFPATSGMDGGSLCCYPWDVAGYGAETLVMLWGDKSLDFIKCLLNSGIDRHICMALDGSGSGWCCYAYSMWSIMNLYWTTLAFTGKGIELFDEMVRIFENEEKRLEEQEHLKNYGNQHNLLEMRSCGYEYFVPSPNAERAWCYDRLADIAQFAGRSGYERWREKAELIRGSIRDRLWDAKRGWFKCLHPDGHEETVYSIQAFDVLRAGACTPEMQGQLLKQVRDGAFLGEYGVSSISAEDELHYEMNDSDWSGRGSYGGDGPNLAETLWQVGEARLAWDVLRRHFWMGGALPYIPQQHDCDRPVLPANSRANIIAGVAGLQAVLFGMIGLRPQLDGSLVISAHPPEQGTVKVENFRHRGRTLTVNLRPGHLEVLVDGKTIHCGVPRVITLQPAVSACVVD
jgi:hypothetical protein